MPVMAKKPDEPKKPKRSGVALGTYTDDDIRAALDAYIADHNATAEHPATVRSAVEAALKLFLKGKGFWPWPPKGQA